jgi:hypothetical protein
VNHHHQRHGPAGVEPLGYVQQVAAPGLSDCQLAIGAEEGAQLTDRPHEPERERGGRQGEQSGKPERQRTV